MNITHELLAEILQSAVAKAQYEHNFSRGIIEEITYSEYKTFGVVRGFLALYGLIFTLNRNLPSTEADKISDKVKSIAIEIYSEASGMDKAKWQKMFEYIYDEIAKVFNEEIAQGQKIVNLGTLLLSAACVERKEFPLSLVAECGMLGFESFKTAASESYAQLLEYGLI